MCAKRKLDFEIQTKIPEVELGNETVMDLKTIQSLRTDMGCKPGSLTWLTNIATVKKTFEDEIREIRANVDYNWSAIDSRREENIKLTSKIEKLEKELDQLKICLQTKSSPSQIPLLLSQSPKHVGQLEGEESEKMAD